MDLTGLEPRRSDLARGIIIARSARPLDAAAQRALWDVLSAAGVIEKDTDDDDRDRDREPDENDPPRRWHAAPWLPPTHAELESQRAALEQVAQIHDIEAVWCFKVETGIDGVAWLELAAADPQPADEEDETGGEPASEIVDPLFDERAEVLYTAPGVTIIDADQAAADDRDENEDDDDEDAEDEDDEGAEDDELVDDIDMESHWRNGTPPFEQSVSFPIERYPEVLEEYDWERFGIALKLSGPAYAGEESVVNAFFALWLSVYQDERADEFEPFQRADIIHDRRHRSALMWVERFAVPATPSDQVHFLLWIVARINEVLPVTWARFEAVNDAVKARADTDDGTDPFVLAGNPFADRFRRYGEETALSWAVTQSAWTKRELAGMLIEVALEHDPDDPEAAPVAERLLRRALAMDAECDAGGYLVIVLVRQHRLAEAIAFAEAAPTPDIRLLVVGEAAEHEPHDLSSALDLLDSETVAATDPEELADLVGTMARHAPSFLERMLMKLPQDSALVPYLYNASFAVERPQALAMLRKVLTLPPPAKGSGEARTAFVMAWNNACIHAHALGEYRLAVELADGGQPFADENPYIYHSAACAYAAVGQIERAIDQVSRAIEHEYEHTEKMETDQDLSPLLGDPRFKGLFVEWRNRRADLN